MTEASDAISFFLESSKSKKADVRPWIRLLINFIYKLFDISAD